MASRVPHLLHIHVSWGTRLLMARLLDKQHIRHKNAFFFIFRQLTNSVGLLGEPSFSSFFFRCYPNFVTRSSWRGRGALERVVTAQKLLNQITASTGVNLWIITFWFLHDRIQGMEGKSLVAFQMQGQVVASAETPIAVATFKRLGSSVLPVKKIGVIQTKF